MAGLSNRVVGLFENQGISWMSQACFLRLGGLRVFGQEVYFRMGRNSGKKQERAISALP